MRAEKGDISISVNKSSECEYKLEAPLGAVSYYGTSSGHAYTTGTTYDAKITANADTGNIALIEAESSGAENSGSENSETENSNRNKKAADSVNSKGHDKKCIAYEHLETNY